VYLDVRFAHTSYNTPPLNPSTTLLSYTWTLSNEHQRRTAKMADKNQNKNQSQKSYKEAAGEYYNQKYETWMPWMEDQYLKWFTKDNKASYATKRLSSSSPPPIPSSLPSLGVHMLLSYKSSLTPYLREPRQNESHW
jgi:hypothetical protein